ncbi:MAG: (Fe-S)-binding protein [Nitrospirae bacterium]|nr:(Fe-S)-binding protein [Nitrospirota bacterium]
MNELQYYKELSRCVRCGACKAICPTYLEDLDEAMGTRGRLALLKALRDGRLRATSVMANMVFSCILCGACKGLCPTGVDILEVIYHGRAKLKGAFRRGYFLTAITKLSVSRMDYIFSILRNFQKVIYPVLYRSGMMRYVPEIAQHPFKERVQVYKVGTTRFREGRTVGRVAIFAGCSVNYFYPTLGEALLRVLLKKGYEVIVLKGEVCCGAPMRALGLEEDAATLAKKNVELFGKMRSEAILTMCPTCAMTIKNEYPIMIGDSIDRVMDINQFFVEKGIAEGLKVEKRIAAYHDPCHLRYGLGIKEEPRALLRNIKGLELIEMEDSECCGFGGLFNMSFKNLSRRIGHRKLRAFTNTGANTFITSCPGCMMQLEDIKRSPGKSGAAPANVRIMHIVELVDEALRE